MKEIGGYIELEQYHGAMLHEDGIKLNCGRGCLAYLIAAKKIQKIALPHFMCDSVFELCEKHQVEIVFYPVGLDLRPDPRFVLGEDTWFYLMNYYGQLTVTEIEAFAAQYGDRLIVDNSQAYFEAPIAGVDTLYTCRKFLGVPDGGILYTDTPLDQELEQGVSCMHMAHLLGRVEYSCSDYYQDSVQNNSRFREEPLCRMSKLTENLLHSIDYAFVQQRRSENYSYLAQRLSGKNALTLRIVSGAFAYPLLIEHGAEIRKQLIAEKIFVPTLWPNVLQEPVADATAYRLAKDVLPLPCDQRYTCEDMAYICEKIERML